MEWWVWLAIGWLAASVFSYFGMRTVYIEDRIERYGKERIVWSKSNRTTALGCSIILAPILAPIFVVYFATNIVSFDDNTPASW